MSEGAGSCSKMVVIVQETEIIARVGRIMIGAVRETGFCGRRTLTTGACVYVGAALKILVLLQSNEACVSDIG